MKSIKHKNKEYKYKCDIDLTDIKKAYITIHDTKKQIFGFEIDLQDDIFKNIKKIENLRNRIEYQVKWFIKYGIEYGHKRADTGEKVFVN